MADPEIDYPSQIFREQKIRRLELEITRAQLNNTIQPFPGTVREMEEYIFWNRPTKKAYVRALAKYISAYFSPAAICQYKENMPKSNLNTTELCQTCPCSGKLYNTKLPEL